MRRFALLLLALPVPCVLAADSKGIKVDFDGMTSTTPAKWVKVKPPTSMRFVQFKLPRVAGDASDAEVVVFKGFGGSAKANVDRWKGQFRGSDDAKVSESKISGCAVTRLELSGTYAGAPFAPKAKAVSMKGYKGVFYQFEGPDKIYHLRLVGPAKTVEAYKKGYDAWVKGFKK